jgi:hypothetical protein
MKRNQLIYLINLILLIAILTTVPVLAEAVPEQINPHWTGKHCAECHVEDKTSKLRYGGDIVGLCNRCHGDVPSVCTKVHITGRSLPEIIKVTVHGDWPLMDSRMTCLTCHEVQLQMYGEGDKEVNRNFLRGDKPATLGTFCFICHNEGHFQKTNPHQLSAVERDGLPCFRCHTQDLVTGFETSFKASVKTENPSLCIGCHWTLGKEHIDHVLLTPDKLAEKTGILQELEQGGIDLPLPGGRMHCATCHNPHPPGIIGRKEAAGGAGEKFFLRISDTQKFCRICHPDGTVDEKIKRFQEK